MQPSIVPGGWGCRATDVQQCWRSRVWNDERPARQVAPGAFPIRDICWDPVPRLLDSSGRHLSHAPGLCRGPKMNPSIWHTCAAVGGICSHCNRIAALQRLKHRKRPKAPACPGKSQLLRRRHGDFRRPERRDTQGRLHSATLQVLMSPQAMQVSQSAMTGDETALVLVSNPAAAAHRQCRFLQVGIRGRHLSTLDALDTPGHL